MTASAIIGVVSALMSIIKLIAEYAVSRKWMDAGTAQAIAKGLTDANDAIARANAARDLVRADIARDPLASCATTDSGGISAAMVACGSFKPVYWSKNDTTATVAQVKENNAAGKALCGWGAAK